MAVVLTPPNARYKIFEMLSNNNINIISEKPFSGDLNSAKKIFNIIKNKKIFFGTTYNYLGYPSIMEIKPLIKKIGKILNFVFEMPQQSFVYKTPLYRSSKTAHSKGFFSIAQFENCWDKKNVP